MSYKCRFNPANGYLQKKENRHAQTKRIYINRAFGSHSYHCSVDGDIDACPESGQGTGQAICVPEQYEDTRVVLDHVL